MNIEEKAKAYDEAKARMSRVFNSNRCTLGFMNEIFPELKESEDERIRKELLEHVKDQQSSFISAPDCRDKYEEEENNKYNSWIAWLEKHGKSDKIVEKAKTEKQRVLVTESDGSANIYWDTRSLKDAITLLKHGLNYLQEIEVKKQIMPNSRFGGCSECIPTRFDKEKQGKKESNDKNKPKFKVGDTVTVKPMSCHGKVFKGEPFKIVDIIEDNYVSDDGKTYSISLQDGWELVQQNPAWSEDDERNLNDAILFIETGTYSLDKDNLINWLKFLKERVQPKQEWSEEMGNRVSIKNSL